uniref:Uncharacterized protein n=1 Tax=Aegilops tauschii subsp. strangulata TaxID=200361 RepID=A0A453LJ68_AEGTS
WPVRRDLLNWQRSGRGWKHSGGRGSRYQPKKIKIAALLYQPRATVSCTRLTGGVSRRNASAEVESALLSSMVTPCHHTGCAMPTVGASQQICCL